MRYRECAVVDVQIYLLGNKPANFLHRLSRIIPRALVKQCDQLFGPLNMHIPMVTARLEQIQEDQEKDADHCRVLSRQVNILNSL